MIKFVTLVLVSFVAFYQQVKGLPPKKLHSSFDLGQIITLHCAKGVNLSVQSITWTKDGEEFYKYESEVFPHAVFSNVNGVHLKEDPFFNGRQIMIGPTTKDTAGLYSCKTEFRNTLLPGLKFFVNVDMELIYFEKYKIL